jgi:hypothetical protein
MLPNTMGTCTSSVNALQRPAQGTSLAVLYTAQEPATCKGLWHAVLLVHSLWWLERPATLGLRPRLQCSNLGSHILQLFIVPIRVKFLGGGLTVGLEGKP